MPAESFGSDESLNGLREFASIDILLATIRKERTDGCKDYYQMIVNSGEVTKDGIESLVKKMPDFTKYNQVKVSKFEELIDAHSEVRMPINFYKDIDRSYFILLSDNTAWQYTMKRRNIERK